MYRLPYIRTYEKEIDDILNKNLPVVVFGNGMLGKMIVDLLLLMKIEVLNICDNNSQVVGSKYKGIHIISPREIKEKDLYVIIATYEYMNEIKAQLKELDIINTLPYYCCFMGQEIDKELYWNNDASIQEAAYLGKKNELMGSEKFLEINSLDIAVTERCSLKCKNCANLIQYYEEPRDCDFEITKVAMERLFQCVDLIGRVSILGGEPLINRDISKYVEVCSKNENIVNILVVTNGTIMPKDELIAAIQADERCILSISDYGKISLHKNEIIEESEKKSFKIAISRREENIWRELGVIAYDNLFEDDLRIKFNECITKKFLSLKDGKLFVCPFASNAYSLKAIAKEDVSYVDLLDDNLSIDELKEQIYNFLNKNSHNECKYCIEKGKKSNLIPAAEQVKKPIEYNKYSY